MKVIRWAFVLGGFVFCLLFLSLNTASAQQPYPRAYLFVEVKDTAGKRITDADVAVSRADGNQILNTKTGRDGITKTVFEQTSDHHYNLQVSKTGYLPYEQVFFLYPYPDRSRYSFISRVEELSNSLEDLKNYESSPVRIVLHTTPVTSAERQAVELQDRKRQLLLAAKRGDPASLRRLLQAGLKADTVDAKGVPAIAWAALAGDAETIKVLCDAGANVRDKKRLGHQALLIYLSEGIFRANARTPGNYDTGTEKPLLERQEETVRRLIRARAGTNLAHSYRGTVLNRAIDQTPYSAQQPHSLSIEIIKLLITEGADVNAADENGRTALMSAAEKGSLEIFRMLLGAGARASVNAKDKQGRTALMYAHRHRDTDSEAFKVLITAGANVNAANEDGQTALMLVARGSSTKAVETLLEAGASINLKDKQGKTALIYSSLDRYADVTKVLIQAGASINEKDAQGWTALMYVPRYQTDSGLQVVKVLIAAGANVNDVNEDGETALMSAARTGSREIIKTLIQAGASINAKDKHGKTTLIHCCKYPACAYVVKDLIQAGASINEKDSRGWTALMDAMPKYSHEDSTAVVKILRAAGANVNDANEDGQTALMLAVQSGSTETIKTLLDSGAKAYIDLKDKQGRTALMYVKRGPSNIWFYEIGPRVVKTLIEAGANVNVVDESGQTPLILLVDEKPYGGEIDMIKALLEAGAVASINTKDKQGRTVLRVVVGNQGLGAGEVALFLASGADVSIKDNQGQTALMIARTKARDQRIIKLLEEAERRH